MAKRIKYKLGGWSLARLPACYNNHVSGSSWRPWAPRFPRVIDQESAIARDPQSLSHDRSHVPQRERVS